jgi:hypothetical protein
VTILITDNRLPGKQVLAETADKQKAAPEAAEFASFGTVLRCSKMRKNRGFRGISGPTQAVPWQTFLRRRCEINISQTFRKTNKK